jgi:hypothetical protein
MTREFRWYAGCIKPTAEALARAEGEMLGIDVGAWITAVLAFGARVPAELANHVPLMDPGPIASVIAVSVASGLMWHGRGVAASLHKTSRTSIY